MKKKRYTEEQIVAILNAIECSTQSNSDACREQGITEQTFYRWKKKYHGMQTEDVRRLKNLEKENARLKKLLADRCLEVDALKDLLEKKW